MPSVTWWHRQPGTGLLPPGLCHVLSNRRFAKLGVGAVPESAHWRVSVPGFSTPKLNSVYEFSELVFCYSFCFSLATLDGAWSPFFPDGI